MLRVTYGFMKVMPVADARENDGAGSDSIIRPHVLAYSFLYKVLVSDPSVRPLNIFHISVYAKADAVVVFQTIIETISLRPQPTSD
jgi:hypothetical protein